MNPRADWARRIESVGLTYHSLGCVPNDPDDGLYWDEFVAYRFDAAEIDKLEAAAETLHGLCLAAVDHACADDRILEQFGIPANFRPYLKRSWARRDPHLSTAVSIWHSVRASRRRNCLNTTPIRRRL